MEKQKEDLLLFFIYLITLTQLFLPFKRTAEQYNLESHKSQKMHVSATPFNVATLCQLVLEEDSIYFIC